MKKWSYLVTLEAEKEPFPDWITEVLAESLSQREMARIKVVGVDVGKV